MVTNKNIAAPVPGMVRSTSEPFTIYLTGEPYVLTKEQLQEQVDTRLRGSRKWNYPKTKFLSFKDGVLRIETSRSELAFEISIRVESDKLHVSCSCGSEAETLCIHALKSLERIMEFRGENYFERYRPNGKIEVGLRHHRFFERRENSTDLCFTPKKNLGSVYHFSDGIAPAAFAGMLTLLRPSRAKERKTGTELTYILIISPRHKFLPFPLPCLGIMNKAGTNVKGFLNLLSGTEKHTSLILPGSKRRSTSFVMTCGSSQKTKAANC